MDLRQSIVEAWQVWPEKERPWGHAFQGLSHFQTWGASSHVGAHMTTTRDGENGQRLRVLHIPWNGPKLP